jgi:uncharacterized membrane protein YgdD (TMEM256/DUF423 family)
MWIRIAALFGATGVILGAFGAHALRARLEPAQLASWTTGVHYQLFHAVALLALVLWSESSGRSLGPTPWLFALGMLLFSGSIYALVLTPWRWFGPVTPIGGLLLIAGWLSLLWTARAAG